MGVQEAFEKYCKQQGIASEQYKEEIRPVWDAAYRAALATRLVKEVVDENKNANLLTLRDAVGAFLLAEADDEQVYSKIVTPLINAYEKVK